MDRMLMILCMLYIWNVTLHTCLFKIDISRPIALDGTLMMAAVLAFCKPFRIDYINKISDISEAETKRIPNRYTSSALCNHPMQHTAAYPCNSFQKLLKMARNVHVERHSTQTLTDSIKRHYKGYNMSIIYGYHHIRLSY